jgi:hypothetical protein
MSGASAHEVLSIRPNRSMSRFARGVLPILAELPSQSRVRRPRTHTS